MNLARMLGNISLRYYHATTIVRIALAFLGIWILFTLPREHYPNIPLYYVHVLVPHPGANVILVEEQVTKKLENAIKELEHVENVNSFISPGFNFTRIAYNQHISNAEFQDAVQTLKNSISAIAFSPDVGKVFVDDFSYADFSSEISILLSLQKQEKNSDPQDELMMYAKQVLSILQHTDGVLKISTKGYYPKIVQVQIDKKALDDYGAISSTEIRNAIQKQLKVIPAGMLQDGSSSNNTDTRKEPALAYQLNTDTWVKSIEDIEDIVIRQFPQSIHVKDIAKVQFAYDDGIELVQYNGVPAALFRIHKTTNTDSVQLIHTIKEQLKQYKKREETTLDISYFADETVYIANTINTLGSNALVGLLFVFIVMLIFLGIKPAFIISMQIPLTFASSFLVLKMMGITLNGATLFALVLVLGMVVDHSITVLENILYNRYQRHVHKKEAILQGLGEMLGPVLTAYFTTIAAFIPLAFMPGIIGDFLYPVPITIVAVLTFSVFTALFIVPSQYMNSIGRDNGRELAFIIWCQNILKSILDILVRYRIVSGILFILIVGASILVFFFTPVSLYDTEEEQVFLIDVSMPHGTTREHSANMLNTIEKKLLTLKAEGVVSGIVSIIGNIDPDYVAGIKTQSPSDIQFQVLVAGTVNEVSQRLDEVILRSRTLIDSIHGIKSINIRKQRTGPPLPSSLEFVLLSSNMDELEGAYADMMQQLTSYDAVHNIRNNSGEKKKEYVVQIDTEALQNYGMSVAQLGAELRYFFAEDSLGTLVTDEGSFDIHAGFFQDNVLNEDSIQSLRFIGQNNKVISFSDIAQLRESFVDTYIQREDGRRVLKILADIFQKKDAQLIRTKMYDYFQEIQSLYPNVELQFEGEFEEFSSLFNDIIILFLIGIIAIYVVLALDFKSYWQPLLIMMTILSTAVGISVYLLITQTSLSIVILYSFLAIMGITVDGAIVLVNTSNRLVESNSIPDYLEAIKVASVRRFKPILLTNITTIAGVLPTALGLAGDSPIWRPMSITIVIGLSTCVFITLFFIPVFYSLLPKPNVHKFS